MFADTKYYRRVVDEDPLRLSAASGEFFLQNKALDVFMLDNIGRNKLPIFLVLGAQDPVVDNDAVVSLLKKGTQQRLDILTYENQKHAIQFQAPEELVADTINWLSKVFVRKLPQQ
jgi:esterase/lipase